MLAAQAVFGLAAAGDYAGLAEIARAARSVPSAAVAAAAAPSGSSSSAQSMARAAEAVLGALGELSLPAAALRAFPELSGLGLRLDAGTVPSTQGGDSVAKGAPNSAQAFASASVQQGSVNSWNITFCSHVQHASPVSAARAATILAQATAVIRNSSFNGDFACPLTLAFSGVGGAFGKANDGLNIINTERAMDAVLGNACGRVHVVTAINSCGGPAINTLGCSDMPGTGMVVVRMGRLYDEADLWAHEFGHNKGLDHVADRKNLMTCCGTSSGGLTSSQCDRLRSASRRLRGG